MTNLELEQEDAEPDPQARIQGEIMNLFALLPPSAQAQLLDTLAEDLRADDFDDEDDE